jgi:hypothetical protein
MAHDHRAQRGVGRDDGIGRGGRRADDAAERRIGEAFQRMTGELAVSVAEFLETVRIEDERRAGTAGHLMRMRVAEPAGAGAVHEIDASLRDGRAASCPRDIEQRIRRAAIRDGVPRRPANGTCGRARCAA